jgi:hypothetical protein
MFSLVSGLSSTSSAAGAHCCSDASQVLHCCTTPRRHACRAYRSSLSPTGPPLFCARAATGSLGSRAWSFCTCVGSSTPQGRGALAISHTAFLPSGWGDTVGAPHFRFRSSIPSLHIALSNASSAASRLPSHGSGPGWFATPFLCDSFIHWSTPVYPDANLPTMDSRDSCAG